jgi:hypothetical protein
MPIQVDAGSHDGLMETLCEHVARRSLSAHSRLTPNELYYVNHSQPLVLVAFNK